jgi:hypothetical protein
LAGLLYFPAMRDQEKPKDLSPKSRKLSKGDFASIPRKERLAVLRAIVVVDIHGTGFTPAEVYQGFTAERNSEETKGS